MTDTKSIITHPEMRAQLNELRKGREKVYTDEGKPVLDPKTGKHRESTIPAHLVNQSLVLRVMTHLRSRGFFGRDGFPYYVDTTGHRFIPVQVDHPRFTQLMQQLGFMPTEPHTRVVANAIEQRAQHAEYRKLHRFAFMSDTSIYIRATESTMLKVSADAIEQVPLGTDGVVLVADDMGDWPDLEELLSLVNELRPLVGNACTKINPNAPLARLTSRWETTHHMTADQQWQIAFTRFMFCFCANRYTLWPILLVLGPGGSGKSTPLELFMTMLLSRATTLTAMPSNERSFISSVTNSTFALFDNVDGAGFDDPKNAQYSDRVCHAATGAKVPVAVLYKTNEKAEFELQVHSGYTSCTHPFTQRADVNRRILEVSMLPPHAGPVRKDKGKLLQAVIDNRSAMLAEVLIRCQNMVLAHALDRDYSDACVADMPEYEGFTLRVAEYEGTLPETLTLWTAYVARYKEAISSNNTMVNTIRLWLGKGGNTGREVSTTTLFTECQTIHQQLEQAFTYRGSGGIGAHLVKNATQLQVLGYQKLKMRDSNGARFDPSPQERAICERRYKDLHKAIEERQRARPHAVQSWPELSASPQREHRLGAANTPECDDCTLNPQVVN